MSKPKLWPNDATVRSSTITNELIVEHIHQRYGTVANMELATEYVNDYAKRQKMDDAYVRVQQHSNGSYSVLKLDNVWQRGHSEEYKSFDDLPEDIQRGLVLLSMVEPKYGRNWRENDNTGVLDGVGKRLNDHIFWVKTDRFS